MEYRKLGNTGINVSRICFGTLTVGPLQANLSVDEGSNVICEAIENGINFIDTAELYKTYPYVKAATKKSNKDVVIASRCYAYSRENAIESLELARKSLDRDVIDIFGLHEQESGLTLKGHKEAIDYFVEAKQKGLLKAILITTHFVEVVKLVANMPEIDVVHPIFNIAGLGIADGTVEEMKEAIKLAHDNGKGIYSMKAFGGGNLLHSYKECFDFVLSNENIHSTAVGMKTIEELNTNLKYLSGNKDIDNELKENIKDKRLIVEFWCEKCGNCVNRCKSNALKIENDQVIVDKEKCLLCGYCASACPAFSIKVI